MIIILQKSIAHPHLASSIPRHKPGNINVSIPVTRDTITQNYIVSSNSFASFGRVSLHLLRAGGFDIVYLHPGWVPWCVDVNRVPLAGSAILGSPVVCLYNFALFFAVWLPGWVPWCVLGSPAVCLLCCVTVVPSGRPGWLDNPQFLGGLLALMHHCHAFQLHMFPKQL